MLFIDLKHKLSLWSALILLVVLAFFTLLLCAAWGFKIGLLLGALGFFFCGGIDSAWYLLTRNMERRIDEHVLKDQVKRSYDASKDNPTIR